MTTNTQIDTKHEVHSKQCSRCGRTSNNPSSNPNEKKCEYCGTDRTYIAVTKNGTPYPKWNSNPFKEDSWICRRCYRNLLYHKAFPSIRVRRSIRIDRIAKRVCHKCGGKTNTQKSKTLHT
jgi:hypothetical protein